MWSQILLEGLGIALESAKDFNQIHSKLPTAKNSHSNKTQT